MKSVSRKLAALSLSCALAVSLAGCGVSVTGVSLNLPDSMEKGATFTATPEYTFDGAMPESADLAKKLDALDMSYTSSDSAVLVVDEDGNMVAVSAGTAEVALSSKDGKITASKTIEVVVTPTDITTTDTLTLTAGEAATLETAVAPDDATHVVISYTSSDNSVATVSDAGEVKAVGVGEADITAAVENTELSAVCKITVLPKIESVDLNYTELSLKVGGTAQHSLLTLSSRKTPLWNPPPTRAATNPLPRWTRKAQLPPWPMARPQSQWMWTASQQSVK